MLQASCVMIMHDLNITFVNYHTRADLLQALASVFADLAGCPYAVQPVVVYNSGNADGARETLAARFPAVRYLAAGSNVGFGRGNTLGFQAERARYYFALNPDTIIAPGRQTIERIIRFMDAHPKIGCIGPKLVNTAGAAQESCYRFDRGAIISKPLRQVRLDKKYRRIKKHVDRLQMRDFAHDETRPVDWILGAAMVVRQEVVDKIGWFDQRYFMYMEDCDWCRTMWEAGWPVYYVHDIVIQHRHARESAKVPGIFPALWKNRLAREHLKSWLKYLWKWRGKHRYFEI